MKINNSDVDALVQINSIVSEQNETGEFELGNMIVIVNSLEDRSLGLIECNNEITERT